MKTPPLQSLLTIIYIVLCGSFIAFIVYKLRKLFLVPWVWMIGSMLIYFICLSGVIYDIIHGVPMVGQNQKGQIEIIHTGQRSQYMAEGFIMGFLITLGGLGIVVLNLISKMQPSRIRVIGGLTLMAVIYACVTVYKVYQMKAKWYGPGFYPPDGYTRGALMRDQGYSF